MSKASKHFKIKKKKKIFNQIYIKFTFLKFRSLETEIFQNHKFCSSLAMNLKGREFG